MGKTLTLHSTAYDGRRLKLVVEQISTDITTNSSLIKWTLTSEGGSVNYYSTGPTKLNLNGSIVYEKGRTEFNEKVFPAAKGSVSGYKTVKHEDDGSKSIYAILTTAIYYETTNRVDGTLHLDPIARYATLDSAPNFYDDENPTITYSNPAGENVSLLRACISLDGTNADVAYRDITKTATSYQFNLTTAERNVLRAATTSGNSRTVKFHLYTLIGTSENYTSKAVTFTIRNPKPTINPTIVDTDTKAIEYTGDSSKLIRYISNAKITIGAAAVKQATLISNQVTNSGKTLTKDGTITDVTSNSFVFKATDSRGNTTTKTVTHSKFVNYIKPTCSLGDNMPDAAGNMTVRVTGNYFNASFGAKHNALNVYYRYKKASDTWNDSNKEWTLIQISGDDLSNNVYNVTANITGLDYKTSYTLESYAKDVFITTSVSSKIIKSEPVFDWGADDFKFNVPVYDELGNLVSGIEEGTSGIWRYRKWSSGYCELWGKRSISNMACTTALGNMYRTDLINSTTMAFPFPITDPRVVTSYENDGYGAFLWPTSYTDTNKPPNYYLVRPTSATIENGAIILHATGRWK